MLPARILIPAGLLLLLAATTSRAQERDPAPHIPSVRSERPVPRADTTATRIEILSRSETDQPTAALQGEITDPDGTPLSAARVVLPGTSWGGLVGEAGTFRYADLPPGVYQMVVQRMGYIPARLTLQLRRGERVHLAVVLAPQPIALEGVEITAEHPADQSRMADFYERRERGRGHFFTRDDITDRQPRDINALLVTLPRVRLIVVEGRSEIRMRERRRPPPRPLNRMRVVQMYGGRVFVPAPPEMKGGSGETNTALAEGDCPPLYFLDGMSFDPTLGDLPDQVKPDEVEGIEVYEAGQAPVRFRQRGAECGVIIIWTRSPWNF
jgi:hypothetical protein